MDTVNYDNFALTFSQSRENMKWEEIEYFLQKYSIEINEKKILDIGCGNGRLLKHFLESPFISDIDYYGIDASKGMIEEAKKIYEINDFFVCDMMSIDTINIKNVSSAFLIASFHHLPTELERLEVLKKIKSIMMPGSFIFLTNWALNSKLNSEKYQKSIILESKNKFLNFDYAIKIGNFERFYHCFSIEELEYLFNQTGFEIVENRLFENEKNFISILKTPI